MKDRPNRIGLGPTRGTPAWVLSLAVKAYQRVVSPWLPPTCRFVPSCSQYFLDALSAHGAVRGSWLGAKRILRCHPLGGHGLDPVPPASDPFARRGREG